MRLSKDPYDLNAEERMAARVEVLQFLKGLPLEKYGRYNHIRPGLGVIPYGFSCTPRIENGQWVYEYEWKMDITAYRNPYENL